MPANLVLLSGGLDSAVNCLIALENGGVGAAVTVDYGQKAGPREIEKARSLCERYGIKHVVLDATWLGEISNDALTTPGARPPRVNPDQLTDPALMAETMKAVWVPNRNGLLVSMGAAVAEAMQLPWVVMGLNAEEGSSFPDNSAGFVDEANRALAYSTLSGVKLRSFTINWNKMDIFVEAVSLGLDFHLIWSCYNGGQLMCGCCESCARLRSVAGRRGVRLDGIFAEL